MSTTATTPRRKGAGAIIFVIGAVLLALIFIAALAPNVWKAGDTESDAGPTVRSMSHGLEDEIIGDVSTGDKVRVHELTVELPDGTTESWEVSGATWSSCSVGDEVTRDSTTGAVTCE